MSAPDMRKRLEDARPVVRLTKWIDVFLGLDISGSMMRPDAPQGKTRWAYAKQRTIELAQQAERIDDDGIDFATFDHACSRCDVSMTSAQIAEAVARITPYYGTLTHTVIERAYEVYKRKVAAGSRKTFRAYILTDGATQAEYRKTLVDTIAHIANEVGSQMRVPPPGKQWKEDDFPFSITFLTVGEIDDALAAFLEELDEGLGKHTPHDIVSMGRLENATLR